MTARTLDDLLTQTALRRPDAVFLIHPASGRRLTFAAMDDAAGRAAALLRRRGVREGDRVVAALPNTPEFFSLLFGAARVGAVFVPLDPRSAPEEMAGVVRHCEPRLTATDAGELARLLAAEVPDAAPAPADTERAAFILYTSGTSGRPKGAVLTHGGVLAKLEAVRERFTLGESDRALCLLPVCFGHALISVCLSALNYGGALVLAEPFGMAHAATLGPLLQEHRVTTFSAVPSILQVLVQFERHFGPKAFAGLRFVTCASAPLAPETAAAFERLYGVPVFNCYGLTETASWIAAQAPPASNRAAGTVGRALGGELRLLDTGEIVARGPSVMKGYFARPDLTAACFDGEWFRTGDAGRLDADGNLFITGRIKELIIRNGMNVSPEEVNEVLRLHPAVEDAATFGLPDAVMGEKVVSAVALNRDVPPSELIAHCRRHLTDYKCPERIRVLDALPRDARESSIREA